MRTDILYRLALVALALAHLPAAAADLTVSAAASLSNAFTEIGKAYEKATPGARVVFNFGASGQLLQQIARGAPVDVFASADQLTMDRAQKHNLIVRGSRTDFVSNSLVIVTPGDAGPLVSSIADLVKPQVQRIGIGTPESVPAGSYAKEALEVAGLWETLFGKYIFGQNVRQVLDYVARGEVDAGFVYATDAALLEHRVRVAGVAPLGQAILYPVAAVKGGGNEMQARAFIAFVQSEAGRTILNRHGFGPP